MNFVGIVPPVITPMECLGASEMHDLTMVLKKANSDIQSISPDN